MLPIPAFRTVCFRLGLAVALSSAWIALAEAGGGLGEAVMTADAPLLRQSLAQDCADEIKSLGRAGSICKNALVANLKSGQKIAALSISDDKEWIGVEVDGGKLDGKTGAVQIDKIKIKLGRDKQMVDGSQFKMILKSGAFDYLLK